MSRGQKPRRSTYFPLMKDRGRKRRRGAQLVVRDSNWRPIWPPVIAGIRLDKPGVTLIFNQRKLNRETGYWEEVA